MSTHTLNINTILHTKDGRKIGNAIVISRDKNHWRIKTDYGNHIDMTIEEIDRYFHVAWDDQEDCDEMQQMMREDHKYRVNV